MPLSILVPTVNMDVVVVVDPHMAIIQVQVGKNLVEDVLYLNLLPTISTWPII
jgi:hypothetical protein